MQCNALCWFHVCRPKTHFSSTRALGHQPPHVNKRRVIKNCGLSQHLGNPWSTRWTDWGAVDQQRSRTPLSPTSSPLCPLLHTGPNTSHPTVNHQLLGSSANRRSAYRRGREEMKCGCERSSSARLSFTLSHAGNGWFSWVRPLARLIVPDRFSEDRHSSYIPCTKMPFLLTSSGKFLRGPLAVAHSAVRARTPDWGLNITSQVSPALLVLHNLNQLSRPWAALAANHFIRCRLWNVNNVQKSFDSIIGSSELESWLHPAPPGPSPPSSPPVPRGHLSGPLPLCITSIRLGCWHTCLIIKGTSIISSSFINGLCETQLNVQQLSTLGPRQSYTTGAVLIKSLQSQEVFVGSPWMRSPG